MHSKTPALVQDGGRTCSRRRSTREVLRAVALAADAAALGAELQALTEATRPLALPLLHHGDHRGRHHRDIRLRGAGGVCRRAEAEADGETDRTCDSKKSFHW